VLKNCSTLPVMARARSGSDPDLTDRYLVLVALSAPC
jgi:hypothetical protein